MTADNGQRQPHFGSVLISRLLLSRGHLALAENTWERHALRIVRPYEQQRRKQATPQEVAAALGLYVRRWQRWAVAGLKDMDSLASLAADRQF